MIVGPLTSGIYVAEQRVGDYVVKVKAPERPDALRLLTIASTALLAHLQREARHAER
ncbi:MAG: hypothetical protein AAFY29_22900 [Pseudomonadota bacterium]